MDVVRVQDVGDTPFHICTSFPGPGHSGRHVRGELGTLNTRPRSGLQNNETPSLAPRLSSLPHSQAFAPAVSLD